MRNALLCSAASVATLTFGTMAFAQQTTQATAAADGRTGATEGLEDIVVTAQRQSENLQRAAVPVDVISADKLLQGGVTGPQSLGALVPALTAAPAGGGRINFFLRGVGNFTANPLFDSAIAFNYDDVYVGRPGSTSGLFYDLQRVEVLKGPQGTLYGRNATGGAINLIPVRPKLGDFSGYVTGSYGNYDAVNIEGAVNIPMGASGALRISGNLADHDGYLSDGTSDEKTRALRVQMLAELTPELTVRLAGDYAHTGGKGVGTSYANAYRYDVATSRYVVTDSGLDPSVGLYDPRAQAYRRSLRAGSAGRNLNDLSPAIYLDNSYYGANAEISYAAEAGTLTVIPAWRYSKSDNITNTTGFLAKGLTTDEQYSVEARFVGRRIGPVDYTLGLYYYDETNKVHAAVGQQAVATFQDIDQGTKSYAAFARFTGHLSDTLRLVGGVRFTADRKQFYGTADSFAVVCAAPACPNASLLPQVDYINQLPAPVPAPGAIVPQIGTGAITARGATNVVNTTQRVNRVTYRGAVEFDLAPQSLLYASFETGFRSGGFSVATGYETFRPEYITAYTVGSKNRFLDNRLQLNIEGYFWKYRGQQLATIALDRAGRQGFFTQNIGKSTIYGVDAESRFLLTRTTQLNAQVQYLHTNYDSFTYQVPTGSAPPYTGCAAPVSATNPAFRDLDCSGMPAFNSPKWTVNLGFNQAFELGDYRLVASADTQYRSRRYVGFEYQPGQKVSSTWTSNANLTFGPADERWSITAFVRNIENDRYAVTANTFAIGSALVEVTAPPRTYGVRASAKF